MRVCRTLDRLRHRRTITERKNCISIGSTQIFPCDQVNEDASIRLLCNGGLVWKRSASRGKSRTASGLHMDPLQPPRRMTVSPPSRTEAEHIIRAQLQSIVAANEGRVLLCADFGYGYPAGFSSLLAKSFSSELPPWRIVWQYLRNHVQDDLGTKPGQQPTNRSNRFAIASAINAEVSSPASPGPFWCLFKPGGYACVPQKRPPQPFVYASGTIASLRITDRRAKSDTPFRLFGTGSVGSQVLTGIPRLDEHPIRSPVRPMLCSLAFRDRMGAADRNLARSGSANSACRNLSERPRAFHRYDKGPRPGTRDVALGARPRRKELPHQRIRDAAGHRERISGGSHDPPRGGLDPGLSRLNSQLLALPADTDRTLSRFWNSGNMEVCR